MPEGDAVRRAATRLDRALRGEPLVGCELRWPSLADRSLHGMTTREVVSRGKHLLHRLDSGMTLHTHLRMEGSWRVRPTRAMTPNTVRNNAIRVLLATSEWTAIGYRLGMVDLVDTRDEHRLVGHLGPDLLGADWDPVAAAALLRRQPHRPIGAALLDQRNLAGLGTIWTTETLFHERVNPWAAVGDLSAAQLDAVLTSAHRLLTAAAVQDPSRTPHAAYGHAGEPCPRCGRLLRAGPIGEPPTQRTLGFCAGCQAGR
ncbi:MAG TPA: DNA-formamidopyrimidine glycosylase family protein [Flexivirga sp.]|uniref:DNA-formamidopyrimidine glycosylase family protein n=1 Tax=Flexivirga sp. TaxID=1962927 RepID=UPI002BBED728|nr:DNA-formamidopyrimidine glycosylase family protein [Flexivirga sp.]HWC20951.1 DNA-formamidopyrimidine glycosylase family protein [Flexivirga sp.]